MKMAVRNEFRLFPKDHLSVGDFTHNPMTYFETRRHTPIPASSETPPIPVSSNSVSDYQLKCYFNHGYFLEGGLRFLSLFFSRNKQTFVEIAAKSSTI